MKPETEEQINQADIETGKQFSEQTDSIISVSEYESTPLTLREEEIIYIIETTPNDMELGKILRKYYNTYLTK